MDDRNLIETQEKIASFRLQILYQDVNITYSYHYSKITTLFQTPVRIFSNAIGKGNNKLAIVTFCKQGKTSAGHPAAST